ncbi:hypothetical protein A8709_10245 [Paenibacillus pectinilyticus]|uniref:Uncharacterized protein n=1 Tax=Paenibacillus pectinilyticus TaxID=512399 RepID=A0A1C1A604_9BACL|nr:GerAB/ArcD/ProY family transporter [Paenibacillus pectinilyticus]OCT15990.1 hypothetical protein A8709_10245 [Paenibacillus pectinilyticus]
MKEESITNKQLFFLVLLAQIGSRVLTLPYAEVEYAGTNGWLAVLLGGCVAQICIFIIWMLGNQYPSQHIYQYLKTSVGKLLGGTLTIVFGLYFMYSALIVSLRYVEMLDRWVLLQTPWWVILLMFFIASGYAAMSSLRVLSFISKTVFIILVLGCVLIIFSGLKQADIRYVLPLWHGGGTSFAYGVFQGFLACLAFDILLYAYPFVQKGKGKILKATTYANVLSTVMYALVVLICSLNFTPEQMSRVPEPIIFILKQYNWEVIQSIDIIFIIFWFVIVATTVYVYLFLTSKAINHIGEKEGKNHVLWVWISTGICFTLACWISADKKAISFVTGSPYEISSVVCVFVIPLLLLIVSSISHARRRNL